MELIDLSLTISPNLPGVSISQAKRLSEDGWNATNIRLYSHCGTHVDAPIHFGIGDVTLDKMPLEHFMANCWIVDCGVEGAKELLTLESLGDFGDKIRPGDGLVFRTGWSNRVNTSAYRDDLPRIGETLARWIVQKKVKLVGVEPPSVADVNNLEEVTKIHRILLGGGVTILEGLANLSNIKAQQIWVLAFPLKIEGGDGCPVRAVAINM